MVNTPIFRERYDATRDKRAWRSLSSKKQPLAIDPEATTTAPSEFALEAATRAATSSSWPSDEERCFEDSDIIRAAHLTAAFTRVSGVANFVLSWNELLTLLNKYPHPQAAACQWLVPALRNLVGKPLREEPALLWQHWEADAIGRFERQLNPRHRIPLFGESTPSGPLDALASLDHPVLARDELEHWRIRAHCSDVVRFEIPDDLLDLTASPLLRLNLSRVNRLARHVNDELDAAHDALRALDIVRPYQRFLLLEVASSDNSPERRKCLRENLQALHEGLARGRILQDEYVFTEDDVGQYDWILRAVRTVRDRAKRVRNRSVGQRQFLNNLRELGLPVPTSLAVKRATRDQHPLDLPPRELAVVLLCDQHGWPPCHPQTAFARLAALRQQIKQDEDYTEKWRRSRLGMGRKATSSKSRSPRRGK